MENTKHTPAELIRNNLDLILAEQSRLTKQLNFADVAGVIPYLHSAARIFVAGAGRSGFAMRSAAMRLMHFGLTVYVVGETTTPAIQTGDLLFIASGSGTTGSMVSAAERASKVGAKVVALSTTTDSPLAALSDYLLLIPAAQKQDHAHIISKQYAGSLFEQSLLLITDAIFQTMWDLDGTPAPELWKRHANLE
ncbi:6-phospho-3-hexuloisomerase [Pedobacter duraquae]|uniref:3-hexulose-6-phosphate isomerase n=1 Tax=Pedobacter duraquae TaxID=425511 RepID=A0A4R6IKW5_9SPHI|nr:6-phospho-3-hexuloisomerase [Pedobacter duraquae]TDO22681.1 3-hexulose-6-phosphate isomerase [Pedobacter duraquae]